MRTLAETLNPKEPFDHQGDPFSGNQKDDDLMQEDILNEIYDKATEKIPKRKKIHAFKSKMRLEKVEVSQNKSQNSWQRFQTTKGNTKKIDMTALKQMGENDLKELGIPKVSFFLPF